MRGAAHAERGPGPEPSARAGSVVPAFAGRRRDTPRRVRPDAPDGVRSGSPRIADGLSTVSTTPAGSTEGGGQSPSTAAGCSVALRTPSVAPPSAFPHFSSMSRQADAWPFLASLPVPPSLTNGARSLESWHSGVQFIPRGGGEVYPFSSVQPPSSAVVIRGTVVAAEGAFVAATACQPLRSPLTCRCSRGVRANPKKGYREPPVRATSLSTVPLSSSMTCDGSKRPAPSACRVIWLRFAMATGCFTP